MVWSPSPYQISGPSLPSVPWPGHDTMVYIVPSHTTVPHYLSTSTLSKVCLYIISLPTPTPTFIPIHFLSSQPPPPLFWLVLLLFLTHMSVVATATTSRRRRRRWWSSSVDDGAPRSFATPRGRISTVPGVPLGHCPPLDHHVQLEWHLLLLLPLGQTPLFPSILLRPPSCWLPHPILTPQ